nr:HGGxSTG domain-containing protein [Frigidibacter sp. RF13]
MLAVLGLSELPYFAEPVARANRVLDDKGDQYAHARHGVLDLPDFQPIQLRCGAIRKAGKPCRHKVQPGKKRCKFHGGCSTGPKSAEGRARIAEAQRKRWAKWLADRASDVC